IVGFFFYLIVGTVILHGMIASMSTNGVLLPVMYVVLLFIPYALFPVALLGLTDTWADWRAKIAAS
ncbi:MAG: hypothetical protein ACRER2_19830, partial [Methylococcales bacterium]